MTIRRKNRKGPLRHLLRWLGVADPDPYAKAAACVNCLPPENIEVRVLADKILESIPGVLVLIKDPVTLRLVRVNGEACRFLQATEPELLHKTIHEVLRDEESALLIDAADREAVRSGKHEMEAWMLSNDGQRVRMRSNRFLYTDKFCNHRYLVTLCQDVTEQHEAYMRAEDLERTTTSLLSGLPFPLMWLDRKQTIKGSNLAFNTFTGVELPVNHSLVDVFPFSVANAIRQICQLTESTNRPMTQQLKVWVRSEADREMVVHCCPTHDIYGQVAGTVSALYDVTDLVRSTKVTSQISRAFDQCTDGVILTNRHNEITYVNNAFCEQYGYTREELVGRQPSILKSGSHDAAFYADMWAVLNDGRTWQGVLVNRTNHGTAITAPTTIVPILNGTKTPVAYLCIKHTEGKYETPHVEFTSAGDDAASL